MNYSLSRIKGGCGVIMKYYFLFALTVLVMALGACNKKPDENKSATVNNRLSAPLPRAIMAIGTIDESNLVVTVEVDGNQIVACQSLIVDTVAGTYSCVATITAGDRSLVLINSIIDPTYGTVRVTELAPISVTVVAGQDTAADLSLAILTFPDDNIDGISNLDELKAGSDPFTDSNWDQLVWDNGSWK